MMKLQTPAGIKFYKCRFTDIYQGPVLVARFTGSTQRRLNYGNAPLLLPHGYYPEWIVGSSLLDIALNKEWPKHDAD
ncbi:alkanesulfonate ABC transporter permease [Klebsiella pneumoniae]|uniref:Alkanesulfonate ABC transporter permease n=1 Tax=Klebsiella pneumoniae TaxID=573 RepID=A0A377TU98_KLEPN|nr:alkanesulfonate ABC transporter permease [Klebsiella pneumoniae]